MIHLRKHLLRQYKVFIVQELSKILRQSFLFEIFFFFTELIKGHNAYTFKFLIIFLILWICAIIILFSFLNRGLLMKLNRSFGISLIEFIKFADLFFLWGITIGNSWSSFRCSKSLFLFFYNQFLFLLFFLNYLF